MIKRLVIVLLLTTLLFGGLFAFKFKQMRQATSQFQAPPPAVVAVTEVKQVEWQPFLSAVGSLVAVSGVEVTNEIAGVVKAIHFQSGQKINQGELMVELDARTDQAELSGLVADQQLAKIRFQRDEKLVNNKFVSKSAYDQNKALLDQANAAVKTKMTLIEKKRIRAPFSGELGIRKINLGQFLATGSTIVSLQQIKPIYIDFTIPEQQLSILHSGQKVNVIVPAYPDTVFTGTVTAISPLIDLQTRSIQVRATLANNEGYLNPGMFAQVKVQSGQIRKLLTLPDSAISYNTYGDFVFVVKSDKNGLLVQSQQVETGITRNGRVEIVSGLNRGAQVVSAGQIKLRNGMAVTIDNKPAPGERKVETTL